MGLALLCLWERSGGPMSSTGSCFVSHSPDTRQAGLMNQYGQVFSKFYERYFNDYAENAAPFLLRFFSSQPLSQNQPRVLDLGCGTGRLALRFLESGYSVTGLDLSPHMLDLAAARCAHFLGAGKAVFIQADISGFSKNGGYSLAVSTYNVMNHLATEQNLRGCFRSVKACLVAGGWFLFDYHTAAGLKAWADTESMKFKEGKVEMSGSFDEKDGRAIVRIKGVFNREPFEETVWNQTFPLTWVARLLEEDGFNVVRFARIVDLEKPLEKPEEENRVVVMARVE
jgi:SAM-dependent methyltransferase